MGIQPRGGASVLDEELKTLLTVLRHQRLVANQLRKLARELETRADVHDLSKLQFDEFGGFVEVNQIARRHAYGSEEYKTSLKDNKAIELHFSRNSHHPEHYSGGFADMGFIDFVEMVCDWQAANVTYGTTDIEKVLTIQKDRFGLNGEAVRIIRLILDELK